MFISIKFHSGFTVSSDPYYVWAKCSILDHHTFKIDRNTKPSATANKTPINQYRKTVKIGEFF